MKKKNFIRDNYGISPLRIFVILFVLIVIVALIWFVMATHEISCDPSDQVELSGNFQGYFSYQNFTGYTVLVISNDSYIFKRGLDSLYLNNLLGHEVKFQCCRRQTNNTYASKPELYYDLISAIIME